MKIEDVVNEMHHLTENVEQANNLLKNTLVRLEQLKFDMAQNKIEY